MSKFALVVFDLDGTLVDSRRDIADAANALIVQCGGAPLDEDRIGRMVGHGAGRLVSNALAAAGVAEPPDALARFLALYDARLLVHTRPYDGMHEVLASLSRRAALALLTNKPLAETRRVLEGLALAPYFPAGAIVGGDGPLPRKPDAAGLRQLMAQAGAAAASTILVGDSHVDWRTARNAGTDICLARYGFGFETFPTGELSGHETVVDAPSELLQRL